MNKKVVLEAISNGFPGKSILTSCRGMVSGCLRPLISHAKKTDITRQEELVDAIGGEYLYKEIVPRIYPKGKKMT